MGVKSEIEKTDIRFGPNSLNRLAEAADASVRGALAALESFYYAWHHPDADALRAVWSDSPLVQLDNPAGERQAPAEAGSRGRGNTWCA